MFLGCAASVFVVAILLVVSPPDYSEAGLRQKESAERVTLYRIHQNSQRSTSNTQAHSNALVVTCAATASPIRPVRTATHAYAMPATIPAGHIVPCSAPKATALAMAAQGLTASKRSAGNCGVISRRIR